MKKALLLEDDRIFNLVFKSILERNGFNVTSYTSPIFVISDGVNLKKFDLIVTDNNMPYMSGWDFLTYIKDFKLTDQRICFNSGDIEITNEAKQQKLCTHNVKKSPVEFELFLQESFF